MALIDIDKPVCFIGYPNSHPALDDLLEVSGDTPRLTGKERPLATLVLDNGSVQLEFTDAYEDSRGPAKAPGFLILESVTVVRETCEENVGYFTGVLPFELRLDLTESEIIAALGEPCYKGEFLGAYFMTYDEVYASVTLKIRLDKTSREITFLRFHATKVKWAMKDADHPCRKQYSAARRAMQRIDPDRHLNDIINITLRKLN